MVIQPLRNFGAVLAILALISPVFAQQSTQRRQARTKPKTSSAAAKKTAPKPKPEATPKADPADEKARYEAAIAADAAVKAELLVKFIADYPKSEYKTRAEESLAGARAAMADQRLTAGDRDAAVRLFKLALNDAPKPYSDRLFTEVLATVPANLYWRGLRAEGIELAKLIETHIAADVNKLLLLSTFYLGSENGYEARRIAEAAILLDEKSSAAHQTLATAHRLNFDLESAAVSFARAVELDPQSTTSKRSLADMKRALGKPDEAETIYREILAVNEKENHARTGLVLALFDLGKRADAEAEMAKALEETPSNVALLAGAAYWYAANKEGDKAVEYARRAIEKEPRYVWSHIALGRGLMLQGKPVEAEQVLVAARKYGNFPTLQYEIASSRLAAGFFREAAEEIQKSFSVADGMVSTRLGGRIEKTSESFADAIALERRASIFAPAAADSVEGAARLKSLTELSLSLSKEPKDVPAAIAAAERFADGSDNMSVHRRLFAANLLLHNGVAADEAAKLTTSAVAGLDQSLDVASPGAAVMASELYEARTASFARNDFLLIPEVPRQTLNSLMRGRVEETAGLALLQQGKPEEASVRFRRALTVLPKDSAWWRSATWNLGTSLAAEGKEKEALDAMIASYAIDKPDIGRYILIERLWTKVNGNRDGVEEKIGPNPLPDFSAVAKVEPSPATVEVTPTPEPIPAPSTEPTNPTPTPAASPTSVEAIESPSPNPSPEITPTPETTQTPAVVAVIPSPSPSPEITPTPETAPTPAVVEVTPTPSPSPGITPTRETAPTPAVVEVTPTPSPSPETTPTPAAIPTPSPSPEATPTLETSPTPAMVEETPTPSPSPENPQTPSENRVAKVSESSRTAINNPKQVPIEAAPPVKKTGSLFEPIIIRIPKPVTETKPKTEETVTEKSNQPTTSDGKPDADQASIEPARPRVVKGKAITGELLPCEIGVSQETILLRKDGGTIALLVSIEEGEDIKLVTGVSNSPSDVEVRREAVLTELAGRSRFVVKSVSEKTGLYQVTFTAPCGKKDVIVRVR